MVIVGEVVGTIETDCGGVVGTGLEVVEVEAVDAVEFLVAKLPPLDEETPGSHMILTASEKIKRI